jgi:hypothetical protein
MMGGHVIRKGSEVFKALSVHVEMVPYTSRAATVFFLVSEDNFDEAWNLWFLHRLFAKGYNVRFSLR